MIKFLDLHKQYLTIKNEIDNAISSVITQGAFIGGKYVSSFEREFADYQKAPFCVGVANGTDALEIAIESFGFPKGSEIIVPANSFIASAEAVTRIGCRVVFCDCNPDTYTVSIEDIRKKITGNTRAIIVVHLYGHPCDMDELNSIASEYNLKIIEDCAQAHGSEYKGKRVGTLGDIGAFSFYPGKNLGAYGDAGAIIVKDENAARKIRMIANHGRLEKYNHEFEGRNSRLDGLQAAILSVKLPHLEKWTERRRAVANQYVEGLKDVSEIHLPQEKVWARHVWHLFVIRVQERDKLKKYLTEKNIETGIHYPICLPKLKAYSYTGQAAESMLANRFDTQLLSLPMGEHITNENVSEIVGIIKQYYK